ncbi:hypothetical protein GCM10027456_77720 [Kineosporia babensis]
MVCLMALLIVGGALEPERRLLSWIGALAVGVVAVRAWVLRIEAGSSGVVVVNYLRTRRLAWAEIRRVSYGNGLVFELTDGRSLGSAAFPHVFQGLDIAREPGRQAVRRLQRLKVRQARR